MAKWNRRQFLSGLMATAGVHATVSVASAVGLPLGTAGTEPAPLPVRPAVVASSPLGSRPSTPVPAPAPRALPDGATHELGSILPGGQRFGRWRIVAVHAVKMGAVPVLIETRDGGCFQVDVLRRDRQTLARRGISETRHYALYLANVGRGSTPTHEEHGLGVMWLAALLRKREHRIVPPALLTLRDRLGQFPDGKFNSLHPAPRGETRWPTAHARVPAASAPTASAPVAPAPAVRVLSPTKRS